MKENPSQAHTVLSLSKSADICRRFSLTTTASIHKRVAVGGCRVGKHSVACLHFDLQPLLDRSVKRNCFPRSWDDTTHRSIFKPMYLCPGGRRVWRSRLIEKNDFGLGKRVRVPFEVPGSLGEIRPELTSLHCLVL